MTLNVNFDKTVGKIKPMHAVNNGPQMPSRMFSKWFFRKFP